MGNKDKNYTLKTKKPYASLTRGGKLERVAFER